ncbi:MAG TPA: hypothetical protein VL092_13955 [Chitinophagaceae bacterium]|nr:hypothetical protein [Chitinophagaceae bacterium]
MKQDLYSTEGLLVLIDCLNDLIDSTGQRDQIINNSKERVISAFKNAANFLSPEMINERLRISDQKFFRLSVAGKCNVSVSKSCMRLCPCQLSLYEQQQIKKYVNDPNYQNLPVNHLWSEAQRNGLFISRHTFSKYVRQIRGVAPRKDAEEEHVKLKKIIATKVFEILHMDSTMVRCLNGERVYIHFIMDNYSRNVLGAIVAYSSKSIMVAKNLENVIAKFDLVDTPFELYCDDGPENHGYVNDLIQFGKAKIKKIVANYSTRKSNNMIEAWNKKFKRVVLKKFKIKSYESLCEDLPTMLDYFNNLPLPVLKTLTPNEVVKGVRYEDLNVRKKINEARLNRLEENRKLNCLLTAHLGQKAYSCIPYGYTGVFK